MRPFRGISVLVLGGFGGCIVGDRQVGTPPVRAELVENVLRLSAPLNHVLGGSASRAHAGTGGLSFPTDVADLPGGDIAILDRMERSIQVRDTAGTLLASWGRHGEGPGEYEEPYAAAGVGSHLAVWDKSGRVTVLDRNGTVVGTHLLEGGDTRAIWQRARTTEWEEPLQLSQVDVTRRLSALTDSTFGLQLQSVDERFDEGFLTSGEPTRFPHHVLRFDLEASLLDTVLQLEGQELKLTFAGSGTLYPWAIELLFASRPLWTAGSGWIASGHGSDTTVFVRFDDGRNLRIEWPTDPRPITDDDLEVFRHWESEVYRKLTGEDEAEQMRKVPLEVIREHEWVTDDRPQIAGLLGHGACLALLGFRPWDAPFGESRSLLIVDVNAPGIPHIVTLEDFGSSFVRSLQDDAVFAIRVEEDGTRSVERYPLPGLDCSRGAA